MTDNAPQKPNVYLVGGPLDGRRITVTGGPLSLQIPHVAEGTAWTLIYTATGHRTTKGLAIYRINGKYDATPLTHQEHGE